MSSKDEYIKYNLRGFKAALEGIPAPAEKGFAPTKKLRQAYMDGWRAGQERKNAK